MVTDIIDVSGLLVRVGVAIAIGGLIGLEREKEPHKYAGLRTLALLCGSGPVVVHLARESGSGLPVAIYLGLAAATSLAIATVRFSVTGEDVGFTTSVTVFLVALLGTLAGYGWLFEATAIAIVTAFLLAEKEQMLAYVDRLTYDELADSMKLAALVFILYPVLPVESIDPFGVVKPREVLLFAIFVLLIEFSSYVSMRQFGGSTGLQVTGLLAGGANSLATAGVMADIANRSRDALDAASSGLLLATVSMIVRNVALASVLAVSILWALWMPALVMIGITAAFAYVLWRRGETPESFDVSLESPFSFRAAVKFSALYVAILLVSVLAQQPFGDIGLYVTAFTGGLVSSAAVSVSAATFLNEGTAGMEVAAGMVVLGIVASLTSKIVLVEFTSGEMRSKVELPLALVGIAGLVAFVASVSLASPVSLP